jgi:hypothetical protein
MTVNSIASNFFQLFGFYFLLLHGLSPLDNTAQNLQKAQQWSCYPKKIHRNERAGENLRILPVQGFDCTGVNGKREYGLKGKPSASSVAFNITAICDGPL